MSVESRMRLDKYLQLTKQFSKKEIQQLLKQHAITVNGNEADSLKQDVSKTDKVCLMGSRITEAPYFYLMVNKPAGILSALKDSHEKTIMDLIEHPRKDSLRIMGRLDRDTTGLMILTNDTRTIKRITLPQSHVEKEYEVTLRDPISKVAVQAFAEGLFIDQNVQLKPAELTILDDYHVKVIISEGRYHQIKKMFLSIHNQVLTLKRIRIHHLYLDDSLALGQYKCLDEQEIEQLTAK